MISRTAEYALRAAVELANLDRPGPVRVDELARLTGVPRNYLSKILHVLVRQGVLVSTRGPQGGFQLAVDPARLRLSRITAPFEPVDASRCLLGRPRCSDRNPCGAHERWKEASAMARSFFDETTLADVVSGGEGEAGATTQRRVAVRGKTT
jgi:Rrf2 family iron-sulfur cluster assembly transcriptional regulator